MDGARAERRGHKAAILLGVSVVASWSESPALAQHDELPASDEPQKTETHGPAFSVGWGSQYSNLGVQVAYAVQLSEQRFRVAPFVALGLATFTASGDTDAILGTGAGAAASWGRKHRLTVDCFYAPMPAWFNLSLHGEEPEVVLEWGPGMTIGYEYVAFSGFFVRTNLGVQYMVTVPIAKSADRFYPALTLIAVGYKLW